MSIRVWAVNVLTGLLPPTRLYKSKAWLWRLAGYDVDRKARVVSSARIWGDGKVSIGKDSFIGHDSLILASVVQVKIGSCCDISSRVSIVTGSHEIDMIGRHSAGKGRNDPITIEDGVWIGIGATILGGITIGEKSIIAAGSVVTSDIPSFVVAVGVPCKVIKKWNSDSQKWTDIDVVG